MNPRTPLLKALQSPHNLRFAEACSLAEAFGFRLSRIGGSHHICVHPAIPELLNFKEVQGQAKACQVRQSLRLVERHDLGIGDAE